MAENQNKDEPATEQRAASGATGGPATARVAYQVDYAVVRTLTLLEEYFAASALPSFSPLIKMEPRIEDDDRLERWDIRITLRESVEESTEAKSNLSNSDVLVFCRRVAEHHAPNSGRTFRLTYGDGIPGNLSALKALIRLAREADDEKTFQMLVRRERPQSERPILNALGKAAYFRLRMIELEPYPPAALERHIKSLSARLAGASQASALRNFLFRRFHDAMPNRETVFLRRLISEIKAEGITLKPLQEDDLSHIAEHIRFLIDAIRHCPHPIPVSVAATASGLTTEALLEQLEPFFRSGGLSIVDDLIDANLIVRRLSHSKLNPKSTAVIESFLEHIRSNNTSAGCLDQVENVITLFRLIQSPSGTLTLRVFDRLDKRLKRFGNKKQVLEFANLCLAKARSATSTSPDEMKDAAKAEAKALICGISWVAQRVGKLAQAALLGNQSLEIGEKIPWPRNTAFCRKCLGRLKRLEAEGLSKGRRRTELLNESANSLIRAIKLFESGADESGPMKGEMGDCWSLLGRTYLVHDKLEAAADALNHAREYLTDENDKDYLDVLILAGDLAVRRLSFQDAEVQYQKVIDRVDGIDAERSEIGARAWLQMGLCRFNSGRGDWRAAIETAIAIWISIDEQYMTAVAKWHLMELANEVPDGLLPSVSKIEPQTRVELVRLLDDRLAKQAARGLLANRDEVPDGLIQEIAKEAASNVQIATKSWTFNG